MGDMREDRLDFITTGWLRYLPEPAFNAYGRMWVSVVEGEALAGDLDEIGAERLDVAVFGGLDATYDPAVHGDADLEPDEEPTWAIRWQTFAEAAAERSMPMNTPRDAINLMRAIGLVERIEDDGEISWSAVVPVPLVEDVLDLDDEARESEAKLRWRRAFRHAEDRVTNWLVDMRSDAPTTKLTITLAEIAVRLDLDLDETRQGLAVAMDTGDITATPHPESAAPGDPIRISLDWDRFDAERISIVAGSADDDD